VLHGLVMLKRRSLLTTENLGSSLCLPGMPQPMAINLHLRQHQQDAIASLNRFNVWLAHRRFGKTVGAIGTLIIKSRECQYTRPVVNYFAPTWTQAKRIAWGYVHEMCDPLKGVQYSESELICELPWNGATLQLGSGNRPDKIRGVYSDFVVIDEPSEQPQKLWGSVVRPLLSDRMGGALFIGTPKGRHGLLYDNWQYGLSGADPEWTCKKYPASQTGLIDPRELASAKRTMTQAEYDQEFECSFDAAVAGAYYAEWLTRIQEAGQVCPVLIDVRRPVYASFDIGMGDATAVWFFQLHGDQIRVIDYCEFTGMGAPQIGLAMHQRGYRVEALLMPHDVKVREWGSGITRQQTLSQLGFRVVPVPIAPISDGIDAVRSIFHRCWFDSEKCSEGLECLWHYRAEWQEKNGIYKKDPLHDWSSHGADSFRTLASCNLAALVRHGQPLDYSRMDGSRCS
jgi:hypothetical protein